MESIRRYNLFVKTPPNSTIEKAQNCADVQETERKSVEWVYGVLFQQFHIIKNPDRLWDIEDLREKYWSRPLSFIIWLSRSREMATREMVQERFEATIHFKSRQTQIGQNGHLR